MRKKDQRKTEAGLQDISSVLRASIPEILALWQQEVAREVPAAGRQEPVLLVNGLAEFLESVAAALDSAAPHAAGRVERNSILHGQQRSYLEGYTVEQVLREYRVLRRTIGEVVLARAALDPARWNQLQTELDRGIEEAARGFIANSEAQVRHIQQVTESTLVHLDLDEMLEELLDRTRTALSADTAVILLLQDDSLRVRASQGLEEEVQATVCVPLGQGFAGKVAATRTPVSIPDIETAEVWSPYIRQKGIRSLLGVPLMVEKRVIGVLHAGSRQPHHFKTADTAFLRLVADRSALTIDRARLLEDLRRADQQKSQFMATVAHELRTPLSAISNALYILENITIPDERANRQLMLAGRQTRQLSRLAEDLLDITRINQQKLELRLEPVALCRIAREAAETIHPLMESRGQDFHLDLPPDNLIVNADPARLEQIVTNLLGNAAKYTEPGGDIFLSIAVEGDEAVLTVRDTGIGIEPVILPQIFDMFHQADRALGRAQGGLGIGLALVRRLVELHGGSIAAHSEGPARGAAFVVRLPLVQPDHGLSQD